MDYIINNIILLLTNIFELYIVHRFMCIFFRNRCADIKVTILMYFVYFVSGSVVMLVAPYPIMNVMSSVLGLFLVTLCYESSLSKKIVTVIIIFMCMFLSEAIIAALIGMSHVEAFDELENIDALVAIVIEIILWLITLILEKIVKNIKYNMPMPKIFMVAIIMVLVSSVYLEIIIFQQPKLNQVLAKTSLISVIMTNFVMIYLYDSLSREFEERTKSEMIKREKAYYHAQSEMLQKNYGELKQFRHDMKNRMLVMRQMVQNNEIDKMSDYISNLTRKLENTEMFSQTGNIALDSIVNYKLNEAINNGIEVKTNIELPVQLSIDDDDIMIILGNLLDNAIEASNRLQKDKSISLEMEYEKDNMIIEVWNRYDDVIHMENGKIATRKNNKMLHGIGLKSVKATVEKYNGTMDVEHDDDIFSVNIILYFD